MRMTSPVWRAEVGSATRWDVGAVKCLEGGRLVWRTEDLKRKGEGRGLDGSGGGGLGRVEEGQDSSGVEGMGLLMG